MASYSLYTDKGKNFSCDIKLEGAKLRDTSARLILETEDFNLIFTGKVLPDGKCLVPIKPLRNILDEGTRGTMILEIIADETYFKPWNSPFAVETTKKVNVKIQEEIIESKPAVSVSFGKTTPTMKRKKRVIKGQVSLKTPTAKILKSLYEYGIRSKNLKENKAITKQLINEYLEDNPKYEVYKEKISKNVLKLLLSIK